MSSSDLASSVMEVTGSTRQVALNLLAACANDVQAAVNLFLANEENDGVDVESVVDCTAEDEVRAPIAPIREQLIGPEDDNFRQANHATGATAKARSLPRIKVCPLRDFAREGSMMEESLGESDSVASLLRSQQPSRPHRLASMARSSSRSSTSTSSSTSSSTAVDRLGDLFRPPTDITVAGTFQYARTRATNMKRWLLVNVQSDNFNSQLLNRDVWSQVKVRNLVKKNFLLWQVSADTSEGSRFTTFYHCNQTPYICLIDPRTGEELWKSELPNQIDLLESLQIFLNENSSEAFFQKDQSKAGPSSTQKSSTATNSEESSLLSSTDLSGDNRKRSRALDLPTELTEEEQILMAVRRSLRENGCGNHSNKRSKTGDDETEDVFHEISDSDDDVQTVPAEPIPTQKESNKNDDDTQNQLQTDPEMHTAYLGTCTDEITTLKIRLVNAGVDESVTIKWPSDTKLRALQLYISEHFPMVKEKFKLISPFPRKVVDLNEDSNMQTLKDANLHPSSTLHVHLDD